MAIRLLSSENVQGNIDIVLSQNAISYLAVTNDNTGVAANARVQVVGESAQLDMIATSAGYTGVTGWADSGIISTDSGASGGLKLNSQSGGIQLQAGTTSYVTMDGSGYVGINMAPDTAVQLSVSGAIGPTNGTEGAPTHTFYGDPDTGMFRSATDTLGFSTGGTTRLSVRAAGIDVVGETETDSLKVTGTTEFTGGATFGGNIIIYNSSNAPYIDFVENGDLTDSKARIGMDQIDTDNATLRFSTEGGGTLSERMRIDENGNVAIQPGGATLTNTRLYVVSADNYDPSLYDGMGGIRISSGGSSSVGDGNYTGGIGFAIASGTSGIAGVQKGSDGDKQGLAFFTHPSNTGADAAEEKMRLDADGNLGIGVSPTEKLDVVGTGGNTNIRVYDSSANSEVGLKLQSDAKTWTLQNWGSGGDNLRFLNNAGTSIMLLDEDGSVGIGTTDPDFTGFGWNVLTIQGGTGVGNAGVLELATPSTDAPDQNLGIVSFNSGTNRNAQIAANRQSADDDGRLTFWTSPGSGGIEERMRIDMGGSVIIGSVGTSGTPAADYRSLEIGRQGNTITGAPWKSNLYLTCNATVTAGSTAFTYRYANEAPARMDLEDGNITFFNAAAGAVGDTISWDQRMIINSSGNVGIGVTSPSGKLEVAGGSTLGFRLSNVGDQSAYDQVRMTYSGYNSGSPTVTLMPLTTPGSGIVYTTFLFQNTNGIDASSNNNANVAIDGTLQVGRSKGLGETTLIMNNYDTSLAGTNQIQNSIRMSGRYWSGAASQLVETRINSVHQESDGNGGSALTFMTQTGGDAVVEQMRIDKVGNVGIGTNSPGAQLHNYSTSTQNVWLSGYGTSAQNTWGAGHGIFAASDNGLLISKANAANDTNRLFSFYHDAGGNAELYMYNTSMTNTVKIDSSGDSYFNGGGNVGIGTTAFASTANLQLKMGNMGSGVVGEIFDAVDNADNSRLIICGGGTGTPQFSMRHYSAAYGFDIWMNTSSPWDVYFDARGVSQGFIWRNYTNNDGGEITLMDLDGNSGTGTLTVKGDLVAYGSPSDVRLKENIKPIESALDKVSKLQGVTFDWKESDSILDIKEDIGFIAQDVQKVVPELVRENEDGKLSLRDKGIVPILVEAIKELKAEIEELKKSN